MAAELGPVAADLQLGPPVIPPAFEEANGRRTEAGLPAIREEVTPHTLRYTCIASLFAAGADQECVAAQVGHHDELADTLRRPSLERDFTMFTPMERGPQSESA